MQFGEQTLPNVTVVDGFWIAYLSSDQEKSYRVVYSDRDGHVVKTRAAGSQCATGQVCG